MSDRSHTDTSKSSQEDSASTGGCKYRFLSIANEVEDVEGYTPGGYCPIDVGDTIHDGRFEVVHKLGYGGIATVWLCWDLKNRKWRAVKINAASQSSDDSMDLKALKLLVPGDEPFEREELANNHIMIVLETFFLGSANGRHLCTVLPLAGPSYPAWEERIFEEFREDMKQKVAYTRRLCRQLTEALAFLHQKGICHGDFRPDNLLMTLKPEVENIGYDEMKELVGSAVGELLLNDDKRSPHAPKYAYPPIDLIWGRVSELVSNSIVLVDFGEIFVASHAPEILNIPTSYAGPE